MAGSRIPWYRTALDPSTLRDLTGKSEARALAQLVATLLLFAATGALALWLYMTKNWLPMVLVCYLYSTMAQVSFPAAAHELSHGTALKTKWLNDAFYGLFGFLIWNNPVHFRASHAQHHQSTLFRELDKEVPQVPVEEKLNPKNALMWITFDVTAFWTFVRTVASHAFGNTNADYFAWAPLMARDDPRRASMIRWARIILFGHLALGIIFACLHLWVLIYLVSFSSFFATWIGKSTNAMQHSGLTESVPDWRAVCHSFEAGPVLGFLYWNMNYHIEHHMYAAVPFYRLRKLHQLAAFDMPPIHRSLLAGMGSLLAIRARQRKDPAYFLVPELPATATPIKWS